MPLILRIREKVQFEGKEIAVEKKTHTCVDRINSFEIVNNNNDTRKYSQAPMN